MLCINCVHLIKNCNSNRNLCCVVSAKRNNEKYEFILVVACSGGSLVLWFGQPLQVEALQNFSPGMGEPDSVRC